MNQEDSWNDEDPNKAVVQKRREETEKEMYKILTEIFKKDISILSIQDKRFLQARQSYLTAAQREQYAEVLAEDLTYKKK